MWVADVPVQNEWVPGTVVLVSETPPPVTVPSISGISPSLLYRNETTRVTIAGTYLTGGVLTASSDAISLTQVVVTSTYITASVGIGEGATDGTYYLTVTTPTGTASVGIQVMARPITPGADVEAVVNGVFNTVLAEIYPDLHAAPTLRQAIYLILQLLGEKSITGTTMTVNRLDGTTPAMTFELDNATDPKTITRTS